MKTHQKVSLAILLSAALGLSACTTTGGGINMANGSTNAAMQGAAMGAVIGALSQSDGNRKDITKGAIVGAAAGAGTGYVLSSTPNYPYKK